MISERAKLVFEELAGVPADAREERLRRGVGLDEGETDELRGLLLALDISPGFLDVDGVMWTDRSDDQRTDASRMVAIGAGSRIGSFTIVREIGRGGMGVVYEAMQDSPKRRVAVKVLRPGAGSRAELARFRREAEMLGRMSHPGIAAVYEARMVRFDADSGEQTPFIAMEYVDGRTINHHASLHRLDARERVQLAVEACRAVHHAHTVKVVHRDISPSNILVDVGGRLKIVDFGVARLSEADGAASLATAGDRVLGKWAYVSPEQAAGAPRLVDHRTDVFALGAVLYELLAGRPWLEPGGRTIFELIRAIEREEPAAWPTLGCAREGDLRIVVETAMHKERGRRYPSASEFGDELERWLRGEAVVARPIGRLEQGRRFISTHRAISFAAGVVALALAAGTIVSSLMAFRARSAEERLTQALHGVIEGLIAPLSMQRGSIEAREKLAGSIRVGIEQIKRARPGDRRVQVAVARYEFETGKLLGYPYTPNLGRRAEAIEHFMAGLELLAPEGADLLQNEQEARLAVSATEMLCATLQVDGFAPKGESALWSAVRACDRWIGVVESPVDWLKRRCEIAMNLSEAIDARGDRAGAVSVIHEAERVSRLHEPRDPNDQSAFEYGTAWIGIGIAHYRLGRHHDCIAAMNEARRFLDRFAESSRPDDRMLMNTGDPHRYIALAHAALGNYAEAESICSHVLALCERVQAAYPERPDALIGFSMMHGERASARAALGDPRGVEDASAAVEYRRALLRDDPRAPLTRTGLVSALTGLGEVCTTLQSAGCDVDPSGLALSKTAASALEEAESHLVELEVSPLTTQVGERLTRAWLELHRVSSGEPANRP